MTEPAAVAKRHQAEERRHRVLEMRAAGRTFREIGGALGCSTSIARDLFLRAERERREDAARTARRDAARESGSRFPYLIDDLHLPARARNALRNFRVETLDDLAKMSSKDLLRLPNFSRGSLAELTDELSKHGISWGEPLRAACRVGASCLGRRAVMRVVGRFADRMAPALAAEITSALLAELGLPGDAA